MKKGPLVKMKTNSSAEGDIKRSKTIDLLQSDAQESNQKVRKRIKIHAVLAFAATRLKANVSKISQWWRVA